MRDAESGVIEQERARKQSAQESFGLMLPGEKALALRSARDVAAGRRTDRQEFEFMQGRQGLFGEALARMGAANAGPMFQEVYKLLGKEERGRQVEQRASSSTTRSRWRSPAWTSTSPTRSRTTSCRRSRR